MFSTEGISLKELMMASRQKSIESHIIYEGPDEEAHAKFYRVLMDIADMITKLLEIRTRMIHIHFTKFNNIN